MERDSSATKGDSSLANRMAGHVHELEGTESYPYVYSSFPRRRRGQCVRILLDNMTALACLRREGSLASEALLSLSMELLTYAQEREISLVPVQLKGKLNVLADLASRSRLFQLLGEIPDPLGKFTGKGFLIAPFWPTAIWFLELEKRCLSRFLLPEDHFLFQEKEGVTFYHKYPSIFRLHVWTL